MTDASPLQLIVGPRGHGVVEYAADIASALNAIDRDTTSAFRSRHRRSFRHRGERAANAPARHRPPARASPQEAAGNLERLASLTRLTITGARCAADLRRHRPYASGRRLHADVRRGRGRHSEQPARTATGSGVPPDRRLAPGDPARRPSRHRPVRAAESVGGGRTDGDACRLHLPGQGTRDGDHRSRRRGRDPEGRRANGRRHRRPGHRPRLGRTRERCSTTPAPTRSVEECVSM